MKPFESFLSPQLNEFVAYRQSLGYTMRRRRSHLLAFDRYLKQTGADWNSFEPSFFLTMRDNLHKGPRHTNQILIMVRVFFQFLMRYEYVEENPLQDLPLLKENVSIPFIFSPVQTDHLLAALCKRIRRSEKYFLTDLATYLALLFLAKCGMRISEPLRLLHQHYRRDEGTLYIEKTKFKKDRLIPLPRAVITEIDNYLSVCKRLGSADHYPYLLLGKKGKPLRDDQVRFTFHQAVKDIGLQQPGKVMGNMNFNPPTPHSLRHSFAINTLREITQRGESSQDALPLLAAYLGHSTYFCSSVYLKIADAQSRNHLYDFTIWQKWKL
jgi:site-specific recombinase XerD